MLFHQIIMHGGLHFVVLLYFFWVTFGKALASNEAVPSQSLIERIPSLWVSVCVGS